MNKQPASALFTLGPTTSLVLAWGPSSRRALLGLLLTAVGLSACGGSSLPIARSDGSAEDGLTSVVDGLTGSVDGATGGEAPEWDGTADGGSTIVDTDPVDRLVDGARVDQGSDLAPPNADASDATPASICTIGDSQYESGGVNPANPCQVCTPQANSLAWSNRDGVACDDGVYCNGMDTCHAGSCSRHAGARCLDDGMFCNGVESCDEVHRRCISSGNPCLEDGGSRGGASGCDESTKQCQHSDPPNDCGTRVCGVSPSGRFNCGTCGASQACVQGRCGCEPQAAVASAATPPPVPGGMKVVCLADPDRLDSSSQCPIITCGGLTYWAFSQVDNSGSMTLVAYDADKRVVSQSLVVGARYIHRIQVDTTAQNVTLIGQANQRIVVPWTQFWQ